MARGFPEVTPENESLFVDALLQRTKDNLREYLTTKLTNEVVKPMVEEIMEKTVKEMTVNVNQMNNYETWDREIRFLVRWKDQQ